MKKSCNPVIQAIRSASEAESGSVCVRPFGLYSPPVLRFPDSCSQAVVKRQKAEVQVPVAGSILRNGNGIRRPDMKLSVLEPLNHTRNARMDANGGTGCLARLSQLTSPQLLIQLWLVVLRIARLVNRFGAATISGAECIEFETKLREYLDEMGRIIVQWKLNSLSSPSYDRPRMLFYEGTAYFPKRVSPTRNLNCLFGKIRVWRWLYEQCEGLRMPSLFPLELQLGIVAGVSTPALADRVAHLSVDMTQRQLLGALRSSIMCAGVPKLFANPWRRCSACSRRGASGSDQ